MFKIILFTTLLLGLTYNNSFAMGSHEAASHLHILFPRIEFPQKLLIHFQKERQSSHTISCADAKERVLYRRFKFERFHWTAKR